MNLLKTFRPTRLIGPILGAALCSLLIGCVAETHERRTRVYSSSPSVAVQTDVVYEDDYVYYPSYEVYYSNRRHQYIYRDGRTWVTRPAPPRVSIDVLLASPSVHAEFRDGPEHHHDDMVRRYPRNWRSHDNRRDDRKDDRDHDNRRRD